MAKGLYEEGMNDVVELMARRGHRDNEIFKQLGIAKQTFYAWLHRYKDFGDAYKRGKKASHNYLANIALSSLEKLINGYSYEEAEIEYAPDAKNKNTPRPIKKKVKTKYVQPNVAAVIYTLNNRQSDQWSNPVTMPEQTSAEIEVSFNESEDKL